MLEVIRTDELREYAVCVAMMNGWNPMWRGVMRTVVPSREIHGWALRGVGSVQQNPMIVAIAQWVKEYKSDGETEIMSQLRKRGVVQ